MRGPHPYYRPTFPPAALAQARATCRQRTAPYQQRQRAALALLLAEQPLLSNARAAAQVGLHPNSVRLWRKRWAGGSFTWADEPRCGAPSVFSLAGPCRGQGPGL